MFLRKLIFDTAANTDEVGELEETLKWGGPSYLTPETKSGSTVRINWKEDLGDSYAIYFKCTSLLVPTFKELYPTTFEYDGNRAIIFQLQEKVPVKELAHCIKLALTYHRVKKKMKNGEIDEL